MRNALNKTIKDLREAVNKIRKLQRISKNVYENLNSLDKHLTNKNIKK